MSTGSLTSSAALAAFIEPFIEGRRALVFGSALASTPRLLLERGARLVHVCDPAPLRVAEAAERAAAPGLSFSTFSDETLASREGGFDCVLVENLGAFDARAVVARAKRLLAPRGVALFVTPNREATAPLLPPPEPSAAPLDYYALYDLVAGEFEHVRMLGQAPFVGYAVVDFAPEAAPEPLIDSEFIPRGSEEPELFIALASRHRTGLPGYAVVQLPLHRVLSGGAVSPRAALPAEPVPSVDLARKIKQQETWITELEARAETADERADDAEEELERVRAELASARRELPKTPPPVASAAPEPAARRELEQQTARLRELEQQNTRLHELERQNTRLHELERQNARLHELERQNARLHELEPALAKLRELEARLAERDARLAELEAAATAHAVRVAERDRRLADLESAGTNDDGAELDALERQLVERGHELRRLERAVLETERVGRELLEELERARTGGDHELSRKLDFLSDRLAASEADRLALKWAADAALAATAATTS
jgi:SAM-dependent methyltransferase